MNLEEIKSLVVKSSQFVVDYDLDGYHITIDDTKVSLPFQSKNDVEELKILFKNKKVNNDDYSSDLIFGKDKTLYVTGLEVFDNKVFLYKNDGSFESRPMIYWILAPIQYDKNFKKLGGNQHYQFIKTFTDRLEFMKAANSYKKRELDVFRIWNEKEAAMIYYGITMFKGLKVKDVSVLSFDIETNGVARNDSSKTLLITNTFRDIHGAYSKRHFRCDHYDSDVQMIEDWCKWVVEIDPSVITGHNIFGFDIPFLQHCYSDRDELDRTLPIGKDGFPIAVDGYTSAFRVDGNTTWDYNKIQVSSRHIVDTMFLAVKYDIGRNYTSWGLKSVIEHEGLIKEGRQFYDASKIRDDWNDLEKRELIVQYGIDDSDDALALYDLMIPSIFYMSQSVPKPFQIMTTSASGAQLNAILIRAYMQDDHSIPKANDRDHVGGGISFGIPGIHRNVMKIDVAGLYPSIIRSKRLYSEKKDPKKYFLQMVNYFTEERFKNKRKFKETKDKYYDDMQASQKVFVNSSYGICGTSGLNYNDFDIANEITRVGRQILKDSLLWATGKPIEHWFPEYNPEYDMEGHVLHLEQHYNFIPVVNDTDSISFRKQNGLPFLKEERDLLLDEINSLLPTMIKYEDDGYYDRVLVLKSKNYILKQGDKVKLKGSSIKSPSKEVALREMVDKIIGVLLE